MVQLKYTLTLTVDEENIKHLYPNYRYNWDRVQEFADALARSFETEGDIDMRNDGLSTFGYSIAVDKC